MVINQNLIILENSSQVEKKLALNKMILIIIIKKEVGQKLSMQQVEYLFPDLLVINPRRTTLMKLIT